MEECGKGVLKEEGGGGGLGGFGGGVGSGMCHPHILAALLLINFSHDQL